MSEEEARRLLSEVEKASEQSRLATERAKMETARARQARADAVQAALDAGIPRQKIADAAGTNRNAVYRLVGKSSR